MDITAGVTEDVVVTNTIRKVASAIAAAVVDVTVVADAVAVVPAAVMTIPGDVSSPKKRNGKT